MNYLNTLSLKSWNMTKELKFDNGSQKEELDALLYGLENGYKNTLDAWVQCDKVKQIIKTKVSAIHEMASNEYYAHDIERLSTYPY